MARFNLERVSKFFREKKVVVKVREEKVKAGIISFF